MQSVFKHSVSALGEDYLVIGKSCSGEENGRLKKDFFSFSGAEKDWP